MDDKIPVTIVTGFLGSGKTTIIQNVVKSIWDKEKVAIVKNEIGDVGVDALELSSPKLQVTELANGCICCTLVGALDDAVREIVKSYSPDRLIIEASGLAKPAQIVIALELVPEVCVDGVIVVVDTLNYKKLTEIEKAWSSQIQSEFIDLYIFNKVDQISDDILDAIKDDILMLKPSARIIETNDADIPASLIFGLHPSNLAYEIDAHEDHDHAEFSSFSIEDLSITSIDRVQNILETLPKCIYRAKGFFSSNSTNYIMNMVAGKVVISITQKELPSSSKFVFIGLDIEKYKEKIETKLRN